MNRLLILAAQPIFDPAPSVAQLEGFMPTFVAFLVAIAVMMIISGIVWVVVEVFRR